MKVKPFARHGNFLQIDNAIVDVVMPQISSNALRILLVIIRQTHGWKKEDEYISYSFLTEKSGIKSRHTAMSAVSELVDFGVILAVKFDDNQTANNYQLNPHFEVEIGETGSAKNALGVVQKMHQGSAKNALGVVQKLHPSIKGSTKTLSNTILKTGDDEKSISQSEITNIESPLAKAIRKVCGKRTLQLSPKDKKDLEFVLSGLHQEGATIEQVEEFGRKVKQHWIGIDSRTKQPQAPRIMQVLEYWYPVLEMEIKTGKAKTTPDDLAAIKAKYA